MPIGTPDRASILDTVRPLCPDIAPDILQDFLSRMDPEYFLRFAPPTIAHHIRLTAQLTPEHPCKIAFAEQSDKRFEITIEDEGKGFERSSVPDPRLDENLEKLHGRGLLLMEEYMDEVQYSAGGRRIRMVLRNEKGNKDQ